MEKKEESPSRQGDCKRKKRNSLNRLEKKKESREKKSRHSTFEENPTKLERKKHRMRGGGIGSIEVRRNLQLHSEKVPPARKSSECNVEHTREGSR